MSVNVEQLFAELLNESSSAASSADLAKLVADRKKRDAKMFKDTKQHSKDIAALQKEVAALKKGSAQTVSIFDMSMLKFGVKSCW